MNQESIPSEDRRTGAMDRRLRERSPASDRRLESRGNSPQAGADRTEPAPAQVDSQMLFERS